MAPPNLINAVARELLLPGNITSAKAFFTTQFDDAPDSGSKRRLGRLLDAIEGYEAKAGAPKKEKPAQDVAPGTETTKPKQRGTP